MGKIVYSQSIHPGKRLSAYDAEMSALAHGGLFASKFVPKHPTISRVLFFSDSSAALKIVMNAGPVEHAPVYLY